MYRVDNAIIMAAGISSRFAPLSYEKPKALIEVNGEILIERQIRQLKEAGIPEIIIVTGYKNEQFTYLIAKYGVKIILNRDYLVRNNNSSIFASRSYIRNSYICSADNYFVCNPFERTENEAYYAAIYTEDETDEWCMTEDEQGYITTVTIGGKNAWYMIGHTFWSEPFSKRFLQILEEEYDSPGTADKLWENIFIEHLKELKMRIKKYNTGDIFEFDTLDMLRGFDKSFIDNTRSNILKEIASRLSISEAVIHEIKPVMSRNNSVVGCSFFAGNKGYQYQYETHILREI